MLIIVGIVLALLAGYNLFIKGDDSVEYRVLSEKEVPVEITENILPEYKKLERALACSIDDKIYVIVTRGEKPTGGFRVDIDKLVLSKEDDTKKLTVYVIFEDPTQDDIVTQVITHPYQIVEAELKELPDEIELKVQYDD